MRETGATSPDIALLPALARLLQTDLNTLFCFQEDISLQETEQLCRRITQQIQKEGFAAGFSIAEEAIRKYPHNEPLLHCLTVQLDGQLTLFPPEDAAAYEAQILCWYKLLSRSEDPGIRSSACYMLAGRYLQAGDLDRAQEILDTMPNQTSILPFLADKEILQVSIYQRQGKHALAIQTLQQNLFLTVQKVQLLLNKLVDTELSAGNRTTAKDIAQRAGKLPALLGLWEYGGFPPLLQIALEEQNARAAIALLEKMLRALAAPQDTGSSPLFYQLPGKASPEEMLPAILRELEQDPVCAFLQGNPEFENLLRSFASP